MGYDYSYFSKEELVRFLNENDKNYQFIEKPYILLLRNKQEKINIKINNAIEEGNKMVNALDEVNLTIDKRINILEQLKHSQELYKKYNLEFDKITEVLKNWRK